MSVYAAGVTEPSQKDLLQQLAAITHELLFEDHPGKLLSAATRLHALFVSVPGAAGASNEGIDANATMLPGGKAISPYDAGRCILEFARTAAFLRGLYAALKEARVRFGAPVEVLYAGCGPFATLAVPLTTRFAPGEMRFTLLDIHQRSLDSARAVMAAFGAEDFVRGYVRADAASHVHPGEHPLHVVLTETMQRALEKEPQAAVTLNLAPQLCAGGILVPERVRVDACLYDPRREFTLMPRDGGAVGGPGAGADGDGSRVRVELGPVLEITAESAGRLSAARCKESGCLPPVRLDVPQRDPSLGLMLRTIVTVFGDAVLGEYDASITCPHPLKDACASARGGRIAFQYCCGAAPGFKYFWAG